MRTNTIAVSLDFRFAVKGGIPVVCGDRPHILLGTKERGEIRIPVGPEFARSLPGGKACSKDGDGAIGVCEECGVKIAPDMVKMVEKTVDHFTQSFPTAKHGSSKVMYRGSAFITKDKVHPKSSITIKGHLMVAEERRDTGELMALFRIEGGSPMLWLGSASARATEEEAAAEKARAPYSRQAKVYDGRKVVGLDVFIVLRRGDKIAIARSTEFETIVRHETLSVEVTDDLQIKLVEVTKSEVEKAVQAAARAELEEDESETVAAPVEEEEHEEETDAEVQFEE
jgi:hypothetical protein